ncbi:hypothetical protein LPJ53_000457 [Coemansia erecta]|uniref:Mediator of RNA polymerase II transcription subunit 11 n=1 Tax=Coemansia erecta TaxID=147472 RepID=A0A9W7Y8F8_9FUNG|nr:hypothetical protein LPJ53_000457 [Coemansia erecta]
MSEKDTTNNNSSGNNNSNGGFTEDDGGLSSFTNFGGADGLDADTMNLFGSFTHDSIPGGLGDLGDGGFSSFTNDLSSFGVDLSSLELTTAAGASNADPSTVDLSSIQLMNLDDAQAGTTAAAAAAAAAANADAADMVARLLGASTSASASTGVGAGAQTAGLPAVDLGVLGQPSVALPAGKKSRASSQSSDDMGDIPLAQLALMQPPGVGTLAAPPNASAPAFSQPAGMLQNPQIPVSVAMPLSMPLSAQQQQQQALVAHSLGDGMSLGFDSSSSGGSSAQPSAGISVPPAYMTAAQPAPAESGTTGVKSTVLAHKPSGGPAPAQLLLDLHHPACASNSDSLAALDALETQLCSLLHTASSAIRIMSGPRDSSAGADEEKEAREEELGESQLKPTIRMFMRTVAEVQAALAVQHRELAARRIPVHAAAGLHSDVAGGERDLALWSDAARLLADAIDTGLKISSS